jgi:iron-sulfur cluster assembly 1
MKTLFVLLLQSLSIVSPSHGFMSPNQFNALTLRRQNIHDFVWLQQSTDVFEDEVTTNDYETPEDAVIQIKPKAMNRLKELRAKQKAETLILRMGVRNGGCSGLSYVMDFSNEDEIQEDDQVDEYKKEGIKCVVDAKSMLYLYGLELDYSEELIGGGFKVSSFGRHVMKIHYLQDIVDPLLYSSLIRTLRNLADVDLLLVCNSYKKEVILDLHLILKYSHSRSLWTLRGINRSFFSPTKMLS